MTANYTDESLAVIVGVGARTPLGFYAAATAAAAWAGVSMQREHAFMVDLAGDAMIVAADPELPADADWVVRAERLAQQPALEALQPLLMPRGFMPRVHALIGLPEPRPGLPDDYVPQFGRAFQRSLRPQIQFDSVSYLPSGHASGLAGFGQALSLLSSRACDACLVGGLDSYLVPETLEWLDETEQLHSARTIWGFCPGEGAAFCAVTTLAFATHCGLLPLLAVPAAGTGTELNRIGTDSVCVGEGLTTALQGALQGATDCAVGYSICDMNGEPYRGDEFGFALLRCRRWFEDSAPFVTPADRWGDQGAASGPLFAVLAACVADKVYCPADSSLLWASSVGGLRAAVLLRTL